MSKIQGRLVVTPKLIPSLSTCKNHSINLLNSSNQFVRYIWFKSPMIYKASLIFDHHRPKIIKITFSKSIKLLATVNQFNLVSKTKAEFLFIFKLSFTTTENLGNGKFGALKHDHCVQVVSSPFFDYKFSHSFKKFNLRCFSGFWIHLCVLDLKIWGKVFKNGPYKEFKKSL